MCESTILNPRSYGSIVTEYPICDSQNVGRMGIVPVVVTANDGKYLLSVNVATCCIKNENRDQNTKSERFIHISDTASFVLFFVFGCACVMTIRPKIASIYK